MAEFEVNIVRIDRIEDHPNADALELAIIGGYRAIVKIGEFKAGDPVVYIPEASVVPQWLLKDMGLEGYLAGKDKNRVKAIKLRGILSQGLVLPINVGIDEDWMYCIVQGEHQGWILAEGAVSENPVKNMIGLDVAKLLGIVKWEPPIPISMAGEVCNIYGKTLRYDIENLKKYPHILEEGEEVVMTEKLHGCLHRDSKVMLSNGNEKSIHDVIHSDVTHVLSYDLVTREYKSKHITGKMKRANNTNKNRIKKSIQIFTK